MVNKIDIINVLYKEGFAEKYAKSLADKILALSEPTKPQEPEKPECTCKYMFGGTKEANQKDCPIHGDHIVEANKKVKKLCPTHSIKSQIVCNKCGWIGDYDLEHVCKELCPMCNEYFEGVHRCKPKKLEYRHVGFLPDDGLSEIRFNIRKCMDAINKLNGWE